MRSSSQIFTVPMNDVSCLRACNITVPRFRPFRNRPRCPFIVKSCSAALTGAGPYFIMRKRRIVRRNSGCCPEKTLSPRFRLLYLYAQRPGQGAVPLTHDRGPVSIFARLLSAAESPGRLSGHAPGPGCVRGGERRAAFPRPGGTGGGAGLLRPHAYWPEEGWEAERLHFDGPNARGYYNAITADDLRRQEQRGHQSLREKYSKK